MADMRADIKESLPDRMIGRPVDHRGFPVPWFVTRKDSDGLWDFRTIDTGRVVEANKHRKCWVSGHPLGRRVAFVIGPMCIVNRIASDPPVIPEIGEWSARVCPFLSRPLAKRPDYDGPNHTPGHMVLDNPGLTAVWVTRNYRITPEGLFGFGDPERVTWWRKGQEVTGSIEAQAIYEERVAKLRAIAVEDGEEAWAWFEKCTAIAAQWSPINNARGRA